MCGGDSRFCPDDSSLQGMCVPDYTMSPNWSRFRDVRPAFHITNVVLRYLSLSGILLAISGRLELPSTPSEGVVLSVERRDDKNGTPGRTRTADGFVRSEASSIPRQGHKKFPSGWIGRFEALAPTFQLSFLGSRLSCAVIAFDAVEYTLMTCEWHLFIPRCRWKW